MVLFAPSHQFFAAKARVGAQDDQDACEHGLAAIAGETYNEALTKGKQSFLRTAKD